MAGLRVALLVGVSLVSSILAAAAVPQPAAAIAVVAAPAPTLLTMPGAALGDIVVDGADHAYVASYSQDRVEVVRLSTRTLEAPIAVPSPMEVDVSPDGTRLYVASSDVVIASELPPWIHLRLGTDPA